MTTSGLPSVLRPIVVDDHAWVLDLNERFVDVLSAMDLERLHYLLNRAAGAFIIEHEGERAGFVLTFAPGVEYDSVYYRWFSDNLSDFRYLDRVVIDGPFHRLGLGSRAYAELEADTGPHCPMTLEVNVDPPNQASLAFHAGRGYREITRLGNAGKQVALMQRTGETEGSGG
ncbi:GNAT family N-acetyltransferase [Nocardioides sp. Bht2]|uniref:GNAT family N-acetyltransferase n=1 Tax=Nocardioides sp. Bht2 TaxID=3392297 RepID=UPI0039B55233